MTRAEVYGRRTVEPRVERWLQSKIPGMELATAPWHPDTSQWIRRKLPKSANGYLVTNIDFILYNWKSKKMMILEIETNVGSKYSNMETKDKWFSIFKDLMIKWIRIGMNQEGEGWKIGGYKTIAFENNFFDDGKVWYDEKEVTEDWLIDRLSF